MHENIRNFLYKKCNKIYLVEFSIHFQKILKIYNQL